MSETIEVREGPVVDRRTLSGVAEIGVLLDNGGKPLNDDQLKELARYFDEEVMSAKNYKTLGLRFRVLLPNDGRNIRWEPDPL